MAEAASRLPRAAALACLLWAGTGLAHEPALTYDRVRISTDATGEVDNDVLRAVLFVEQQGESQAEVADAVNRAMTWALEQARPVGAVSAQTLGYRTSPIYRQQTLTGWRARQSVRLESNDAAALGELVGVLQERLGIESIGYDLDPGTRRDAEQSLIATALAAFRERAALVARELGRHDYRIVSLDISTSGGPPPGMPGARMATAAEGRAMAPPAIESGHQRVQVTVSGEIELRLAP